MQAYLLATAAPARKTRSGGIIVFGFQAGMIAGMAIGSLRGLASRRSSS